MIDVMERSSPLATTRPPTLPGPWGGLGQTHYNSSYLAPSPYNGNAEHLRDLSNGIRDYFSCKPARESSPTSSLAMDLSQNFHIDQTPKLPTPRRSLFTTALLRPSHARAALTPPEPSSSPGVDEPMSDISPLPHKLPTQVAAQIPCSPTPEETPPIMETLMAQPMMMRTLSNPDELGSAKQRKPLAPIRPFLRKGSSLANLPPRPKSATSTSFQFGPALPSLSKTSLESFAESPPPASKGTPSATLFSPSCSSSTFLFAPCSTHTNEESPVNGSRKAPIQNVPGQRGRYRRTQSMQCNNVGRTSRQEKRFCASGSFSVPPPLCIEDAYKLKLPHFRNVDDPEGLPRITKETCVAVLNGNYVAELGAFAIVDCRFEYEYQGGHIDGAINYNDKEELAKQLFDDKLMTQKAIIFHCEYSAHRAPLMAKFIRQRDRAINQDNYPKLTYPELYILDGGYSAFFTAHPVLCFPQNYVEMSSTAHETACELGMAKVKRRAKLSRSQTYAFGQSSSLQTSGLSGSVAVCGKGVEMSLSAIDYLPSQRPPFSMPASTSNLESMDIDLSSPFRMPDIGPSQNKRHGLVFRPATRLDRLESY